MCIYFGVSIGGGSAFPSLSFRLYRNETGSYGNLLVECLSEFGGAFDTSRDDVWQNVFFDISIMFENILVRK